MHLSYNILIYFTFFYHRSILYFYTSWENLNETCLEIKVELELFWTNCKWILFARLIYVCPLKEFGSTYSSHKPEDKMNLKCREDKGKKDHSNFESFIRNSNDMPVIQTIYFITYFISLVSPKEDEKVTSSSNDSSSIYEMPFEVGLHMPLQDFIRSFLSYFDLAPRQLMPNSRRILLDIEVHLWLIGSPYIHVYFLNGIKCKRVLLRDLGFGFMRTKRKKNRFLAPRLEIKIGKSDTFSSPTIWLRKHLMILGWQE